MFTYFCLYSVPWRFCTLMSVLCRHTVWLIPYESNVNHTVTKISKNICRGPGCRCGKYFYSREELQAHYYEKGCYKCSKCDDKFPSGRFQNCYSNLTSDWPSEMSLVSPRRLLVSIKLKPFQRTTASTSCPPWTSWSRSKCWLE